MRWGHTAIAYIIEGEGRFQPENDPYGYEMEGRNYFDFERENMQGPETFVHFNDGDEIEISAGKDGVRFLLVSAKPIEKTGGMAGADSDEHQGRIESCIRGIQKWNLHKVNRA